MGLVLLWTGAIAGERFTEWEEMEMVTVWLEERDARGADDQLWPPVEAAAREIGWEVGPERFCGGGTCAPMPPGLGEEFLRSQGTTLELIEGQVEG